MFDAPPFRFLPGEYRVRRATAAWEHAGCARLRRAVFCDEQGIFDGDDRDAIDAHAIPLAAIACVAGQPEVVVGTVRIHRDADGMWWGSRLAVHADYRRSAWLGSALIRFAVGHAHALGCRRFLAQVQEATPQVRAARASMPMEYDDTETFRGTYLGAGERLVVDLPPDERTPPFATYTWDTGTHLVTVTAVCSDRARFGTVRGAVDDLARSLRLVEDVAAGESAGVLRIDPA